MSDLPHITRSAAEQVDAANSSGLRPVVFIHGLWLLPSSWDRWAGVFAEAGYAPVSPGWPDDPETVEEANAHPEVFAGKSVGDVADHYSEIIAKLDRKPAVIGHSFGGLLTMIVAGRGLGGGVGRDRLGTLPRGLAAAVLRAQGVRAGARQPAEPAPRHPADLRPVPLRLRQRRQRAGGAGALPEVRRARLR